MTIRMQAFLEAIRPARARLGALARGIGRWTFHGRGVGRWAGVPALILPLGLGCYAAPVEPEVEEEPALELEYQSCYPQGERPPPVSPLYSCFIEWCTSACDDPVTAKRERRAEQILAPGGDAAEQCWAEKTGTSDQYVNLERGCIYARSYSQKPHEGPHPDDSPPTLPGSHKEPGKPPSRSR